jgi:hypothetical protein
MRESIVHLALSALLLALSVSATAQQPEKGYRIGILAGNSHEFRERRGHDALQQGLRELGYVDLTFRTPLEAIDVFSQEHF